VLGCFLSFRLNAVMHMNGGSSSTIALIADNLDCDIVIGGDFNVDFSRTCVHTALLCSFCDDQNLHVAIVHPDSSVDCMYHFNMTRFSI
jgi:hypothetical protein